MYQAPKSRHALGMGSAALVLDFDGTILDTEDSRYQSWSDLWERHGLELDRREWQSRIGLDGGFDPWAELEGRLEKSLDPADADWRQQRRNQLLAHQEPRDGVVDWLNAAQELGIGVGVASSSSVTWVDGQLRRLGLRHYFASVVCCDRTVPAKPDPTSFRLACEHLGAEVTLSVAVEDSPPGVAAAAGAGLYTIAVPHPLTADVDLSAADLVVESLSCLSLPEGLDRARSRSFAG